MDIYFVRHGQTMGNVAKRHQAEKTPLSDLGVEQAKEVAKQLKALNPTHLVSSNLIRTIETARPIAKATGLDIETEPNLIELIRPKYLHGRLHYSPHSFFYYVLWFLGIENRKLAGESYMTIRQRIAVMQNILRRYPSDARVVVVSHSVFISLFLAHMCRPSALPPWKLLGFVTKVLRIPNGSIVHVQFNPEAEGVCRWQEVSSTDT